MSVAQASELYAIQILLLIGGAALLLPLLAVWFVLRACVAHRRAEAEAAIREHEAEIRAADARAAHYRAELIHRVAASPLTSASLNDLPRAIVGLESPRISELPESPVIGNLSVGTTFSK